MIVDRQFKTSSWQGGPGARSRVSTQVVARDRHAELLQAITWQARARSASRRDPPAAAHAGARGRRALQSRPKGSSAMPRRSRPSASPAWRASCAATRTRPSRTSRLARARHLPLWTERVILPDSTILLDYLQHLAIRVVRGMVVHEDRMRENLDLTYGALFCQRALLALVTSGMTRDEAYRVAQELTATRLGRPHPPARTTRRAPGSGPGCRHDLRPRPLRPLRAADRDTAALTRLVVSWDPSPTANQLGRPTARPCAHGSSRRFERHRVPPHRSSGTLGLTSTGVVRRAWLSGPTADASGSLRR